jgi:hypothetical protein
LSSLFEGEVLLALERFLGDSQEQQNTRAGDTLWISKVDVVRKSSRIAGAAPEVAGVAVAGVGAR